MDELRPPFRARWHDLLLLLFLVLDVVFIIDIIIIVVIVLCDIRVPFLLFLALAPARLAPARLAPARLAFLSRSLCPIGHRV